MIQLPTTAVHLLLVHFILPYSGKLSLEKSFTDWWKIIFFGEKSVADCSLVPPKDTTSLNFVEKISVNSHKTSKFSPSKVSRCMVSNETCCISVHRCHMHYTTVLHTLVNQFLSSLCSLSALTYFQCVLIFEELKTTEGEGKTLFGQYTSPRLKVSLVNREEVICYQLEFGK